jgi:hypothetical protein
VTARNIVPGSFLTKEGAVPDGGAPFRMTRNVAGTLSQAMLVGIFNVSYGCALTAFTENKRLLNAVLAMYHFEHHANKDAAAAGAFAKLAIATAMKLAPGENSDWDENAQTAPRPCDFNILQRLKEALSCDNLSQKEFKFHPWF